MLKKTLCVISRVIEKKLFFTTFWWGRGFLLGVSAKVSITNSKWRYFFERDFK